MADAIEKKEEKAEPRADLPPKEVSADKEKPDESRPGKRRKKPKEVRISERELRELSEKAALADQYFDRLLRLQADFENFRKRKEKERLDMIKYATEGLVCELVPVLTNFERALAAAEQATHAKGVAEGVEMILKQLKKVLKDRGMEEICPLNAPFDPYKHEAVERLVTDEHPHGHVLEVFQKGYALNDRVLQPAAVKVAASPSEPSPETEGRESPSPGQEARGDQPQEKTQTEKSQDQIEEGSKNG